MLTVDVEESPTRPPPGLVSVVIPVRDGARTLPAQLAALAAQTYRGRWEVIVADNGSTDGTAELAASWADRLPGLRVVDAADRPGVAHARNVGAAASDGDFIVMCDADDVVRPGWLAAMAEASRTADVVGGKLDDGPLNDDPSLVGAGHPAGHLPVAFDFLPYAVTANVGVHADVLERLHGWRTDYVHGAEDIEFSWRAQLASYRLAFAPDAVVLYRYRPGVAAGARQAHRWGMSHVQLYRDHRGDGARARPLGTVARVWGRLLVRAPLAAVSRARRTAWVRAMAFNAGLVRGSLRYRVVCL